MKKVFVLLFFACISIQFPLAGAASKNADNAEPTVSGTTKGNTGCAILEKHMPVKGKLLAVGVLYARTEYRVLETYHCKLPRQKFTGQGQINELNHAAAKDKIKLVILPSKYTPEQLNEAKKICGQQP